MFSNRSDKRNNGKHSKMVKMVDAEDEESGLGG